MMGTREQQAIIKLDHENKCLIKKIKEFEDFKYKLNREMMIIKSKISGINLSLERIEREMRE